MLIWPKQYFEKSFCSLSLKLAFMWQFGGAITLSIPLFVEVTKQSNIKF